jgi:hypothetical protein
MGSNPVDSGLAMCVGVNWWLFLRVRLQMELQGPLTNPALRKEVVGVVHVDSSGGLQSNFFFFLPPSGTGQVRCKV